MGIVKSGVIMRCGKQETIGSIDGHGNPERSNEKGGVTQ